MYYKLYTIIFSTLFIHFSTTDKPMTLLGVSTREKAQILRKIQPGEALPIVLFFNPSTSELQIPKSLNEIKALHGRIVEGTKFNSGSRTANKQMFFCPNKNSEDKCLIAKKFKTSEQLQCAEEPVPVIHRVVHINHEPQECGPGKERKHGTFHRYLYKICENQEINGWLRYLNYVGIPIKPKKIETKLVELYTFCYDLTEKKMIFTAHEIKSPTLLGTDPLFREHEIEYPMMNDQVVPSNQSQSQNAPPGKEINSPKEDKIFEKRGYRSQKLVPSEDMPLALWRKSTFQYFNTEFQHEKLFKLWNKINDYIRARAIYVFGREYTRTQIVTGVFDIPIEDLPESKDDDQILNVWIKLIFTKTIDNSISGVAIFMNNFINTKEYYPISENPEGKFVEKYCGQNHCVDDLKRKFQNVGGYISCCEVTDEIQELFGMKDDDVANPAPLSLILNVTTDYI